MGRKKKYIELSESEKNTLREGSKHHPKSEFRQKCQGLLLNNSGMDYDKITEHLVVNKNTVCNWIKTWEKKGIAGLARKNGQGRPLILSVSNKQHTEILDKAVESHYQNIKAIQADLVKELATPMSSDTVKRFLKKIIIHTDVSATVPIKRKTK
jgi:transposase